MTTDFTFPANRKVYQRLWQRENREELRSKEGRMPWQRKPKECIRKATDAGSIHLVAAGLLRGREYRAVPKHNGAILLTIVPVKADHDA